MSDPERLVIVAQTLRAVSSPGLPHTARRAAPCPAAARPPSAPGRSSLLPPPARALRGIAWYPPPPRSPPRARTTRRSFPAVRTRPLRRTARRRGSVLAPLVHG